MWEVTWKAEDPSACTPLSLEDTKVNSMIPLIFVDVSGLLYTDAVVRMTRGLPHSETPMHPEDLDFPFSLTNHAPQPTNSRLGTHTTHPWRNCIKEGPCPPLQEPQAKYFLFGSGPGKLAKPSYQMVLEKLLESRISCPVLPLLHKALR